MSAISTPGTMMPTSPMLKSKVDTSRHPDESQDP
jgi:hypothetical protein